MKTDLVSTRRPALAVVRQIMIGQLCKKTHERLYEDLPCDRRPDDKCEWCQSTVDAIMDAIEAETKRIDRNG